MEANNSHAGVVQLSFKELNVLQASLIKSESHREVTAQALHKTSKEVTSVELMDHWIDGGGRELFNSRYQRTDLARAE